MTTQKRFRITFRTEDNETMTFFAEDVNPSSFLGLIEVNDIVFHEASDLIITPEDDKVRKAFKDVQRTFLPINSIVRIDEVVFDRQAPVIRLHGSGDGN